MQADSPGDSEVQRVRLPHGKGEEYGVRQQGAKLLKKPDGSTVEIGKVKSRVILGEDQSIGQSTAVAARILSSNSSMLARLGSRLNPFTKRIDIEMETPASKWEPATLEVNRSSVSTRLGLGRWNLMAGGIPGFNRTKQIMRNEKLFDMAEKSFQNEIISKYEKSSTSSSLTYNGESIGLTEAQLREAIQGGVDVPRGSSSTVSIDTGLLVRRREANSGKLHIHYLPFIKEGQLTKATSDSVDLCHPEMRPREFEPNPGQIDQVTPAMEVAHLTTGWSIPGIEQATLVTSDNRHFEGILHESFQETGDNHQALTREQALDGLRQAFVGLETLHSEGISHGNIQPQFLGITRNTEGDVSVRLTHALGITDPSALTMFASPYQRDMQMLGKAYVDMLLGDRSPQMEIKDSNTFKQFFKAAENELRMRCDYRTVNLLEVLCKGLIAAPGSLKIEAYY